MNETTEMPIDQPAEEKKSWRRFARGRKAIAAGAAVAGLAIGGAGFGVGYAVGDNGATTQQTTTDQGDRGFPGQMGDGRMGTPPDGQLPGGSGGTTEGGTGQAPDFDGDGQPDTDTDSGTTIPDSSDGTSQS